MDRNFQRTIPDFSSGWEEKRVIIAALFLPVTSNSKKPAAGNSTLFTSPSPPLTSAILRNSLKTPPPESMIASLKAVNRKPTISSPTPNNSLHSTSTPVKQSSFLMSSPKKTAQPLDPVSTGFFASNAGNPGLYNAVTSLKHHMGPVEWIGTSGCSTDHLSDEERNQFSERMIRDHDSVPVFVSDTEMEGHYHQFCKQILWKPFHYQLPDYPKPKGFEESAWKYYCKVNQLFADMIVSRYRKGDIVWINDYHLMMVPEMVRKQLPDATIGFFLHIPFPSSEIFRCLSGILLLKRDLLTDLFLVQFVNKF
jgi:trehalose-6-phosphate synthase